MCERNKRLVGLNSKIPIIVQVTHIHFVSIDILYDELKEMKGAPSQQASLSEFWKEKVPKKETKAQPTGISPVKEGQTPAATTPIDSKVMDVDARSSLSPESSRACKPCSIQTGRLCLQILGRMQLAPISKDLQSEKHPHPLVRKNVKVDSPPYQPSHIVDYISLDEEPIVKPVAKKRKVIASDDEDLPDDGSVAITSKVLKKEKKRSRKAQAKVTDKITSRALESSSKKVLAVEPAEDGAGDDVVSDEEELAAASTT